MTQEQESLVLSEDEIRTVTKKKKRPFQEKALSFMGVKFVKRPDNSLVVSRHHIEQTLGYSLSPTKQRRKTEPNWSALDGPTNSAAA